MNYKYQRRQLFGKRLPVPKNILEKVYSCTLSFKEFLEYDLTDKIPLSCLIEEDRKIVEHFGLERAKMLDWDLLYSRSYYLPESIRSMALRIDPKEEDINSCLWDLVKDVIRPSDYSKSMKEKYSDRLFDLDQNDPNIVSLINSFNDGELSLETIVLHWDLFHDKDLSYCLSHDKKNNYPITDSLLKEFMSKYGTLTRLIIEEEDIYSFIPELDKCSSVEEKEESLKSFSDQILERTLTKYGDYRIPITPSNEEYKELFKHTSFKEFLLRENPYSSYDIDKLFLELDTLPEDYLYTMPIPISLLSNHDVLTFVSTYGLRNVVDFDLECGNFFTKDNCQMLLMMFDMYMHYAGNEHDPTRTIYTRKTHDENGNYVDLPYTKDEFYEAMRRMIIYGPSDWNYHDKAPDYREMTGEFRTRNQELFIDGNAPEELKKLFYTKSITPLILREHPEYIPFLERKSIPSYFKSREISVHGSTAYYEYENLYQFLIQKAGFEKGMEFITDYADFFEIIFNRNYADTYELRLRFMSDDSMEVIHSRFDDTMHQLFIQKRIPFPEKCPDHFIERYPSLFLSMDTPKEVRDAYYNRKIDFQYIYEHPEYQPYLESVDMEFTFPYVLVPTRHGGPYHSVNFVNAVQQVFGNTDGFHLVSQYGGYLQKLVDSDQLRNFEFDSESSKEDFISKLNETISRGIIFGEILYGEDAPTPFQEQYPTYFLDKKTDVTLREKFYRRELSLKDFAEHPEFMDSFQSTNIVCGFPREYAWMIPLFENEENFEIANYNRLKVISAYSKIQDVALQRAFQEYMREHAKTINIEQIEYLSEVLSRLSLSNSSEIFTFRKELASLILQSDHPIESLNKIEDVFIHNNIPTVGKIYSCFEILHPDFKGFQMQGSQVSPMLQKSSNFSRMVIVFSDLLRASMGSNNKSISDYLKNIEKGSSIYQTLLESSSDISSLSLDEQREFTTFYRHLITLYNNSLKGKREHAFTPSGDVMKDMENLKELLAPEGKKEYKLEDRLISMFCGFSSMDTLEEAKKYMCTKVKTADQRNRMASESDMVLEKGDFIKGIGNITYLHNILQNGSVSKEFLGSSASSDATPLDTDVSMILSEDGSIREKMDTTAAASYGPIWFVLKNDDRFITTRTPDGVIDSKRDLSKLEVFHTGVLGSGHYGIRTGFASSEINYIVMNEYDPRVGLEIAMNGFYIPIANKEGKIIFTPKDYDELRSKMSGLSYFGEDHYSFSSELVYSDVEELAREIDKSNREVREKRSKINQMIEEVLQEMGYHLKTQIDGDLSEGYVELIDTGSTGRGTNKPGDGDFDFMMRLDRSILTNPERLQQLKKKLLEKFGKSHSSEITGSGDFRLKSVPLDEDTMVDIDITFSEKTDKVHYSTDMSLQDRLSTIFKEDPEKYHYVVANILLAKKVLKEAGAYKPNRGENPQGGLGGVGIENWILQHGGSFLEAARSFVEASQGKSFEEFSNTYAVWDFGENHLAEKRGHYSHDNFVKNNMSDAGYQRMVNALTDYLKKIELTSTFEETKER